MLRVPEELMNDNTNYTDLNDQIKFHNDFLLGNSFIKDTSVYSGKDTPIASKNLTSAQVISRSTMQPTSLQSNRVINLEQLMHQNRNRITERTDEMSIQDGKLHNINSHEQTSDQSRMQQVLARYRDYQDHHQPMVNNFIQEEDRCMRYDDRQV